MGRWSRRMAPGFVAWLDVAPDVHWLDVGCGTGALTTAVCAGARPASVTGCDPAEPFIAFARERVRDPRVSLVVAGVGALPAHPGGYGSIASLFALNFFPSPGDALREMRSLAAPGAVISACVWDYAEGMEFLRTFWDAATEADAGARDLDEGRRFPLCRPDALETLFNDAGLRDVRCEGIEIPTVFDDFDDYWGPLLGGTGPAPTYVATLEAARREALAAAVARRLAREADGSIALTARAWAVRGTAD